MIEALTKSEAARTAAARHSAGDVAPGVGRGGLLGASNLTRAFGLAVPLALTHARTAAFSSGRDSASVGGGSASREGRPQRKRETWEVYAAAGNGRSYGNWSSFLFARSLPGIAECGLWQDLSGSEQGGENAPCYALLTDLGNDIAYGQSPDQILQWVDLCLGRLLEIEARIVLTGLPLHNLRTMSSGRFDLVRRFYFPFASLTYEGVVSAAEDLDAGLRKLVRSYDPAQERVRVVDLDPSLYSYDAIHLHTRTLRRAWGRMFAGWWTAPPAERGGTPDLRGELVDGRPGMIAAGGSSSENSILSLSPWTWVRLWTETPCERRLFGRTQRRDQPALHLPDGTPVSLF